MGRHRRTWVTTTDHRARRGDDVRHLWTTSGVDPWPCGGNATSGRPAACGYERDGDYVYDLPDEDFDSLREWALDDETCDDCAHHLRRYLGLPMSWPEAPVVPGGDA